jgi:uncharacterized membrane protein
VTGKTILIIVAFLIVATTMEVSGDALVRNGIMSRTIGARTLYFLIGAVLVFGYALTLNLAPIEFHKVVGIYIATLFVVWQVVSFAFFRTRPDLPILVGGSLIVAGGLVVAFWQRTPHA